MNPDCPDCGKDDFCPKHKLEYLKWVADVAQREYLEELKAQSKKKLKQEQENERK